MNVMKGRAALTALSAVVAGAWLSAQTPAAPTPRPFPGSGSSSGSTSRPATPAAPTPTTPPEPVTSQPIAAVAPLGTSAPDIGNVPMYPNAEFLESYDAGRGQRYFLYGANTPFDTVATYYKQTLKSGGKDIYPIPRMVMFELGPFKDDRMAYPPSVVVKDYSATTPAGYLFVRGSTEKRYQTIIQVVPPALVATP